MECLDGTSPALACRSSPAPPEHQHARTVLRIAMNEPACLRSRVRIPRPTNTTIVVQVSLFLLKSKQRSSTAETCERHRYLTLSCWNASRTSSSVQSIKSLDRLRGIPPRSAFVSVSNRLVHNVCSRCESGRMCSKDVLQTMMQAWCFVRLCRKTRIPSPEGG